MAHIHLFMNNPTSGSTDGTEISTNDNTLPLTVILDASQAEEKAVKVAVRCDTGFEVDGDTEIYFEGTNAAKWQVAEDNSFTSDTALTMALWQSTLTIADVANTNKIFWVKASSSTTENPQNDRTVKLVAEGLVVATE